MIAQERLSEQFEAHRRHLLAAAYRMLGSLSEAEDAVQEGWLRLCRAETEAIENLGGWLTRVVSRVCLDMLRSRKSRREEPLDTHPAETYPLTEDREAGPIPSGRR
ncbi:sigma factor [Thermobacillus composti]|uniref:sigma factor n=1 Tax=Thermobacillus composti TaxID=377615 RepID=UPI00022C52F9|nr:sigma factor [Thermobacillus composti]